MRSFDRSEQQLERAERVIPLGSQTFSKSRTQYPVGVSPLFADHGKGARLWDVDGNEYIDFVSSLLSITLGYCDPDVDGAVRDIMASGSILSLPHVIETEVAELIVEMVPSVEQVRFGKNGSDATAGAVRIARAFTGRDHILTCGYHGWQDWYIGSTARNLGVPEATRMLTHGVAFNDLPALERRFAEFPGQIAALIMEPMNVEWPAEGYYAAVRALCDREGALLVFDETITGFRFANGGAQALFNVTPDLSCFGKGLANGFPLAALGGRADVMRLMEDVFFSFTFGGDMLSLAAAKATLLKLRREPVVDHIGRLGTRIADELPPTISAAGLDQILMVRGHPSWTFLTITDPVADGAQGFRIKTLLMQELQQRGFLSLGTHNLNYAHSDHDVDGLLSAYAEILPIIAQCIEKKDFSGAIRGKELVPLFKVR